MTLPERIADWRQKHEACAEWIGGVAAYNELLRDSLELVPDLAAAYADARTALESSDRDRQKLKADRLDLLAQLESIDQAAAKFYPGEKMLFGEATSRLVEEAGKWKAQAAD